MLWAEEKADAARIDATLRAFKKEAEAAIQKQKLSEPLKKKGRWRPLFFIIRYTQMPPHTGTGSNAEH